MTPLLFISIVTLVLVTLVYWILNSLEKRPVDDESESRNNMQFETAQELFKYLDPQPEPEQDVLRLQADKEYVHLYWHISSDTWDSTMDKFGLKAQRNNVIIRLYDSNLSIMDIPAKDIKGGQKIKTENFQVSYAVLGIKVNEDFVPLFLSRSLE
ncbi:hypothetical protein ASZ90_019350 [hydrocarbon metagenome]|uniref:DUF4912 domain-containing protein n=1 Tax=hydrocarbon metagenome TaxID=938273 RepID=A0A0W8E4I5_9ZZZZ